MRRLWLALLFAFLALSLNAKDRSKQNPNIYIAKPKKVKVKKVRRPGKARLPAVRCVGCPADSRAVKHSSHPQRDFMRMQPCPSTGKTSGRCPGWAVGYMVPLADGGLDEPANMQWQWTPTLKANH